MSNNGFGISRDESVRLIVKTAMDEGVHNHKQIAYMLATAEHESQNFTKPEETAGRSQAIKRGYHGGPEYFGRGYVHLTHIENYEKMDNRLNLGGKLINNVELAKDPEIAAKILVIGMQEGHFTGAKIGRYINDGHIDYRNARRVINGLDKADSIAEKAKAWEKEIPKIIDQIKKEPEKNQKISAWDVESSQVHIADNKVSNQGQSKYEETRVMLQNLLNDTNGSYAKKLVAENPGEVIRFSESNVQQQQELAERENRNMQQQEEPQRSFSRSV